MQQVQFIKNSFTAYAPAAVLQPSLASLCLKGLLTMLDRLHLYSAPIIISAECVAADAALLSGKGPLQG